MLDRDACVYDERVFSDISNTFVEPEVQGCQIQTLYVSFKDLEWQVKRSLIIRELIDDVDLALHFSVLGLDHRARRVRSVLLHGHV